MNSRKKNSRSGMYFTYFFTFSIAFPLIHFLHSITPENHISIIVYSIKALIFIPILSYFIKYGAFFLYGYKSNYILIMILIPGTTMFFANFESNNNFFFIADFLGILSTYYLYLITYLSLKHNKISFYQIIKTLKYSSIFLSISIVSEYIMTGAKTSFPPNIELGMTLMLGFWTYKNIEIKISPLYVVVLLIIASVLSGLRALLLIIAASFLLFIIRLIIYKKTKRLLIYSIYLVIISTPIMYTYSDILLNRLDSITISSSNVGISTDTFKDASANQRFLEFSLIYNEIMTTPEQLVFGKGFGGEYQNKGNLDKYGDYVHNAHTTIGVILLRNGIYGVLIYLFIALYWIRPLFSKNTTLHIVAVGFLMVNINLLFNQFLYWGLFWALSLGILHYAYEKNKLN